MGSSCSVRNQLFLGKQSLRNDVDSNPLFVYCQSPLFYSTCLTFNKEPCIVNKKRKTPDKRYSSQRLATDSPSQNQNNFEPF